MADSVVNIATVKLSSSLGPVESMPANPRTIAPEAMERLKASIQRDPEFMRLRPIVVGPDGIVIGGNQRLRACAELGIDPLPDGWVVRADALTDEQRRRFMLVDNAPDGMSGAWDFERLASDFADIDLAEIGFSADNMISMFGDGGTEGLTDPDQVPEPPAEPVTQPGDLWLLGEHRVLCGDSTSPQDVEQLMDGQLADLLLTDPPYNVNYQGSNGKKIENDNMAESQFRQFLLQAYSRAFEACRTGASAYIFHADTEGEAFRAMFREAGWGLHGCLVWVKNTLVLGHSDYHWQHEPCLYGWKPGANHYFVNDRIQTTVIDDAKPDDLRHMKKDQLLEWAIKAQELLTQKPSSVIRCDKPTRNAEHPTMKPVVLCGRFIKNSSLPGQTVLDLFGGSGSTLIACEQTGRRAILMELDPTYCDVIVKRWEDFTGRKAERHGRPA